jgi:hypothetical protein
MEKHLQDCIETRIKNEKAARPTRPNREQVDRSDPIVDEVRNQFENIDFGQIQRPPSGKAVSFCTCRHCGVQLKVSISRLGNHLEGCHQLPEEVEHPRNAFFDCPICLRYGIPQSRYRSSRALQSEALSLVLGRRGIGRLEATSGDLPRKAVGVLEMWKEIRPIRKGTPVHNPAPQLAGSQYRDPLHFTEFGLHGLV